MRGILLLILAGIMMVAGCTGQPQNPVNVTNNVTNTTPVAQCNGPVCGSDGNTYATDCEAVIANVSVNHTGACVQEATCVASNSGLKLDVAGTAMKGTEVKTDTCVNNGTVAKFTCDNNSIVEVDLPCTGNTMCNGGACVPSTVPPANNTTNVTPPVVQTGCVGPSQANFTQKSSVTFNGQVYNDTCNDYRTVKDYYCQNDKVQTLLNECDPGYQCNQGVCQQATYFCTDSDNGENLTVIGRTVGSNGINTIFDKTDTCLDDNTVKEYDCAANGSAVEHDDHCPLDTKCANGACVASLCSSTVAWNDTTSNGGVTIGADKVKHYDTCIDDRSLLKYFCNGDSVDSTDVHCAVGYICNLDTNSCLPGSKYNNVTGPMQ